MYRPGDVLDVTLTDLPGLPGWTLAASALVLQVTGAELLLYAHDHDPQGAELHVLGELSTALDRPVIEQPITSGPAVGRVLLGPVRDRVPAAGIDPSRALAALAPHIAARASTPLDATQLGVLDLAQDAIAARRAAVSDAEQHRDRIVQRLVAGGLGPTAIARPGLSASRISQIGPSAQRTARG